MPSNNRINLGIKLGLSKAQASRLAKLTTPSAIQDYIGRFPTNFELRGETNLSVAETMRQNHAHCLEGAFVAACALWVNGTPPLLMNLRAKADDDHAVVLFRKGKCWGAISKSNHVWLRWRDPVYRSLRELAMSYLHEYVAGANKSLHAYSAPFDLRRLDPALWITNAESCTEVAEALADTRHYQLLNAAQLRDLRARDKIEIQAGKILEHAAPSKKLASRY